MASLSSCKNEPKAPVVEPARKMTIADFAGMWTIDIKKGGVGWLEVRQEDKYPDGALLWIGGSVVPVSDMFIQKNNILTVTMSEPVIRTRDDKNNAVRTQVITDWLEIKREGDMISGIRLSPKRDGSGVDTAEFKGKLLPAVPPAPDMSKIKYGTPITLFNGKDLTGWRLIDTTLKCGFKVVDGVLTNDPVQPPEGPHVSYGNLRTVREFEDFNLKLEVNVPATGNSGVYLRGMYEIQVIDSYKKPLDSHYMGALYSRITPSVNAEKPAGTWQTLDITLCDRHVTVLLNGVKIIDNQPVYGPTGGAMKSDVFSPGPIYLQGDHDRVSYRNLILTPIVKA